MYLNVEDRQVNPKRGEHWVNGSHRLGTFGIPQITFAVQQLGRLDLELIEADTTWNNERRRGEAEVVGALDQRTTFSWLWVLGAYEVVRSVEQRMRDGHPRQAEARTLKHEFERVRMPLAKFEAPKKYRSDSGLAWPVINALTGGIAWQVASGVFVDRRDLADAFLEFLLGLPDVPK
jgi:hypothetical protein